MKQVRHRPKRARQAVLLTVHMPRLIPQSCTLAAVRDKPQHHRILKPRPNYVLGTGHSQALVAMRTQALGGEVGQTPSCWRRLGSACLLSVCHPSAPTMCQNDNNNHAQDALHWLVRSKSCCIGHAREAMGLANTSQCLAVGRLTLSGGAQFFSHTCIKKWSHNVAAACRSVRPP